MKTYILLLFKFVLTFIQKNNNKESETIEFNNILENEYDSNQIYINGINTTHFSCDNGKKILSFEKLNDNYCDCEDGSDENKTNACINGKFYCKNYLYFPKVISTSKINDGICDCCDGTDEPNFNCSNTCMYYSNLEYKKYILDFDNLRTILDSYDEDKTKEYFNDTFIYISEINKTYNIIKNLYQDKILIERYLNSKTIQKDESVISRGDLDKILFSIDKKINKYKNDLIEEEDSIYSLIKMGSFNELLGQNKLKLNFDEYNCELTKNKFFCKNENGNSKSAKKLEKLNFGQLSYTKNNIAIFNKGYDCKGYPGVSMTAEIIFLCGNKDSFKLNYVDNLCFYSFFYYTYLACNNEQINKLIQNIDVILNH